MGASVLHVGGAMWAHAPWIGRYYPAGTTSRHMLAAYARLFDAVEGNTTFYALPSETTVARWAADTPTTFRFCFKLPRSVTHDRRLRGADDELRSFLHRLGPLEDRLGPTSIQLPPSFAPGDLPVLAAFLRSLPRHWPWAVEVRHPGFFVGGPAERPLDELLRELGVNRVIMDSRSLHAGPGHTPAERDEIRSKPALPVRPVATAASPVVRFIGQADPAANPPFWQPWIATCARWLERGLEPFVFLHTPDNLWSLALARQFHADVSAVVAELAPLPS